MDRIHSAPAAVSMARSFSTHSVDDGLAKLMTQRSFSTVPALLERFDESSNDYTVYPSAATTQQPTLNSIDESFAHSVDNISEYSPAEYINTFSSTQFPSLSSPANADLSQLPVPQLTSQWNISFEGSTEPSTPTTTGLATPPTLLGSTMSRSSSVNTQLMGDVSMMRVSSCNNDSDVQILTEDSFPSSFPNVGAKNISFDVDHSNFLSPFTGSSNERHFLSNDVSCSSASAQSSFSTQSYLVEDMQRSTSHASHSSSASSASTNISTVSSNDSRHLRRDREIIAQSSRRIAPKEECRGASSRHQMLRLRSQDGSSKDVGVITKQPYVRPTHPKTYCDRCTEHPQGFRGEHELRRHQERAHATVRKVWICVDNSPDKKFLANCKHCRNHKQYNAYYNAAAHLRRAHFNPRKRGRKGKHDEKRGGIGGGDKPPMEELKQYWMRELDVPNPSSLTSSDHMDPDTESQDDAIYPSYPSQEATDVLDYRSTLDPYSSAPYATVPASNQTFMHDMGISGNFTFGAPCGDYEIFTTH